MKLGEFPPIKHSTFGKDFLNSSFRYLNKRERVLKERRNKFESIMNNQLGMSSKKQKIEMEESRLKSDIKKALNQLKVKSKPLSLDTSSREGKGCAFLRKAFRGSILYNQASLVLLDIS